MAAPCNNIQCADFLEFQDAINKMRTLDDKIIYALNTSIPTESFKAKLDPSATCKDLYDQLKVNYDAREAAIKNCILLSTEQLKELKALKEQATDNPSVIKAFKKEQTKLRLLRSELGVEEVVRERSLKVYRERCRSFYKPPGAQL
ncbi:protein MIX23 [Bacillus rossius redtenbacheri]|uniref:protein MIX23 n=1 Tax=Bacillus rossius redtenbacheri TaxID=93214 RepID=UPI002FDD6155